MQMVRIWLTLVSSSDTEIVYQVKGLMSDETQNNNDRKDMDWHDLRRSLITVNLNTILRGNPSQTDSGNAEYIAVPEGYEWTTDNKNAYNNAPVAVVCELSDVKIINETLSIAKQELEALVNAEAPSDMAYTDASLQALADAKDAGQAVLDDANAIYRDVTDAIAAINAAKAELVLIGHTVMTFTNFAKDTKNLRFFGA